MNGNHTGSSWRWLAVAVVLAAGMSGCAAYYHEGPPAYRSAYYHSPYYYYYYPRTHVYFHLVSGYYYYPDGERWIRVRDLPPKFHLDRHDRIPLWIDSERPYQRYSQHRERYRPDTHYRPDPARDPEERRHNQQQHERYRERR